MPATLSRWPDSTLLNVSSIRFTSSFSNAHPVGGISPLSLMFRSSSTIVVCKPTIVFFAVWQKGFIAFRPYKSYLRFNADCYNPKNNDVF